MERTVTIPLKEYNELLEFKKNIQEGKVLCLEYNAGYNYPFEYIRFYTENEALEKMASSCKRKAEADTIENDKIMKNKIEEKDNVIKKKESKIASLERLIKLRSEDNKTTVDTLVAQNEVIERMKNMTIFDYLRLKKVSKKQIGKGIRIWGRTFDDPVWDKLKKMKEML